jgi:hypothetical protein
LIGLLLLGWDLTQGQIIIGITRFRHPKVAKPSGAT